MSNTRAQSFNWLLIPLFAIVIGVFTMRLGVIELYLLLAYTIFVVAAHIHYGIRVVCFLRVLLCLCLLVAVSLSRNIVGHINEVSLCRAR